MPKGPDPRLHAAPPEEVPRLLARGAEAFGARRFWDAHEAWEEAWHSLRAAGRAVEASYARGMILVAAAFENATRGKEEGFKRQMAEGLHALLGAPEAAEALGVEDARAWERALCAIHADACRRRDWSWWSSSGWAAPAPRLRE